MQKISFTRAFWVAMEAKISDLEDHMEDHINSYAIDDFIDYISSEESLCNALLAPDHIEKGFDRSRFHTWIKSKTA